MRASCALHSLCAIATRCVFVGFFNMCALSALCMRTVYAQRASNTLCMRCQLSSFSQILTKVGRTTTHWSYFYFFYALTVRRVCVTGPLYREHSHSLNLSKSYDGNGVFTFPFANPFCGLFCNFFFCTIYQNTIGCDLLRHFYTIALQFLKKSE